MTIQPATRTWEHMTIPTAGTYVLDQAHRRIGFVARHMMVSPIRGEFANGAATIFVGEDPLTSWITATIQAASIGTGNPERDEHLRSPDFLDAERFPTLEFRSTGIRWPGEEDPIFFWAALRNQRVGLRGGDPVVPRHRNRGAGRFVLAGQLTVRAVTLPVDLHVEFGGTRRDPYGRDIFGFTATADIDREEYGLLWNVVLESGGVLVGKNVHIEIAGEAIRQG